MNKKKSILESNVLYTIIAIVIGFLVGAIFLTIAGISPAVAYGKLFSSIFSKPKYLVWTLVYAAPLIFTGLSVAFSFRTGNMWSTTVVTVIPTGNWMRQQAGWHRI